MKRLGASVIWSCHVGIDRPNDLARTAWDFLRPHVGEADAYIFSRPAYRWEGLPQERLAVIPPCIDAFASKNQLLEHYATGAILQVAGILDDRDGNPGQPVFHRLDGSPTQVRRRAELIQERSLPRPAPVMLQVSRWDRLKDPLGVLHGFADHVGERMGAHLVLAGPAADSVSDDPEGVQVLREVRQAWERLPRPQRSRVHLACLPMANLEENGAIVNALQRRADVLVQESLADASTISRHAGWSRSWN